MVIRIEKVSVISISMLIFLFLSLFLNAEDGKSKIIANPPSLKFYAVIGTTTTPSQVVSVFASKSDDCRFESNAEWISVSTQSSGENNYILQIKIDPRNLDIGIYEGFIKVAENITHNDIEIPVLLTIESKGSLIKNCHY